MANLLSYALTSVSDVKESLGIASSDTTKDNLITRKINQATRAIEAYCGRRFKETTYTNEAYAASNIDQITLKNYPLTATQTFSLGVRDTQLNQDDFETVETTLYFANTTSGVIDLNFRAIGHWSQYRVTYSAGYATIPEDLAEACASLSAFYVNTANGVHVALAALKEGQREQQYSRQLNTLTFRQVLSQLGIDEIVDSYANMPVMTDR